MCFPLANVLIGQQISTKPLISSHWFFHRKGFGIYKCVLLRPFVGSFFDYFTSWKRYKKKLSPSTALKNWLDTSSKSCERFYWYKCNSQNWRWYYNSRRAYPKMWLGLSLPKFVNIIAQSPFFQANITDLILNPGFSLAKTL